MQVEIGQIFTQVVSFLVMLWVLKRFAWKPLFQVLEDRRHKIQLEFESIEKQKKANLEEAKDYAEKLKGLDAQALKVVQEAKEKGLHLYKELENDAHARAKSIIDKAQEQLKDEISKARQELKLRLVDITLKATEKLIETDLDPSRQKKLIDDFIEQAEIP